MAKRTTDEIMTRRFYILNAFVTIVLTGAIFISILEFGTQTWTNRQQVALIIPGSKDDIGWNRAQTIGMIGACKEMNYDLLLRDKVSSADNDKIVEELAKKGVSLIFFANDTSLASVEKYEKIYPRIRFYAIESTKAQSNISRYTIDYIGLRYVSGILAGLRTKTNRIGYAAPTATAPVMQGINAFTLGVQHVNPEAQVILVWTGSLDNVSSEQQAVRTLKAERVDIMTYFHNGKTIPEAAEQAGIDYIAFHESYPQHKHFIGAIETDWEAAYIDILKIYRRQTYAEHFEDKGLAELKLQREKLTLREKAIYDTTVWQMKRDRQVFHGEIYDRDGILRCSANEIIGQQYLQSQMDWLVKGVRTIGN